MFLVERHGISATEYPSAPSLASEILETEGAVEDSQGFLSIELLHFSVYFLLAFLFTFYSLFAHFLFTFCSLFIQFLLTFFIHFLFTFCSLFIHFLLTLLPFFISSFREII